jgi:hypothetical protein
VVWEIRLIFCKGGMDRERSCRICIAVDIIESLPLVGAYNFIVSCTILP